MPQQYPFSAVVGSDDMALALILTTVSPEIGGVLVRGEKGTAKSTIVRALAAVLPPIDVVAGDRFSSDPRDPAPLSPDGPFAADVAAETRAVRLVELPVGATEDRVLGSLHLERALSEGRAEYEPGLLAKAHRGILYVDEVNLLHDHLVDLLLDAAAMGRSTVERDGVSVEHAARFVLVGTMNPEEGELRPQLLDRFGLTVEVAAPRDPALRVEVVRRRMAYDADPDAFAASYADAEARPDRADPGRPGAGRRRRALRRDAAADRRAVRGLRGRRDARRHRHRPHRRRARRLARAGPRSPPRTSGPPPCWRCRTAAAATRSTRPASTRTCSTRCSARTSRSRIPSPSRRAAATADSARAMEVSRQALATPPQPPTCRPAPASASLDHRRVHRRRRGDVPTEALHRPRHRRG